MALQDHSPLLHYFRGVLSKGERRANTRGKDCCTRRWHREGLWGTSQDPGTQSDFGDPCGAQEAEGRGAGAQSRSGEGAQPPGHNPCQLHAAHFPSQLCFPPQPPRPSSQAGAQQGTESKGLSPSRQPEFTSTQTLSASLAERGPVGRKAQESRDASEQAPHKAHDMHLENSSKICFPQPVLNPPL